MYLYLFIQNYTGSQCIGIGPLKKLGDDAILEPRRNTSTLPARLPHVTELRHVTPVT